MRKTLETLLFLLLCSFTGALAQEGSGYQMIVNAQNPVETLDRSFVADIYLKKIKHWSDNSPIQPVDQRPDSPARRMFSEDVLDRSVMGVKSFWQQMIFSGTDVPPPELKNDPEVIRYVSIHPGAIGYVSGEALNGINGVKRVTIR